MSADDARRAQALADLCRFVAGCYYEPEPAFTEERLFESLQAAATAVDSQLARAALGLGQAFVAQDLQTLLVDYTRLFLGPGQPLASPYGSSWLPRPADADADVDPHGGLLALYREGGFDLDPGFADLPDHVAVELEFLYLLHFNLNQARATGETTGLGELQALKGRFMVEHLGQWGQPFAAAVQASASTAFYRELGQFTAQFLKLVTAAA
ncbi:MAG: molecular chaperone TorD family protein [Vitreoscilla sp.]|nr:molecular chaperone TorD family protein [Vitreoscilla sp.]